MTEAQISRCHVRTLGVPPPFDLVSFSFRRVTSFSHLARALPLVVALADVVLALRAAGCVAAARPAPGKTVITPGAPLAPEPIVADSAWTLSLMVALWSRGAEGARARPTAYTRHQVPGTRSASVAALAVGQAGTHAAAGVEVAHVARSQARIANCAVIQCGFSISSSRSVIVDYRA